MSYVNPTTNGGYAVKGQIVDSTRINDLITNDEFFNSEINALISQLATEISARQSALTAETARAESAETTNAAAVVTEKNRAQAAEALAAKIANNLSDLANVASARANLGLGTAALQNTSAFDPAGSAASAQTTAETFATNAVATETTRAEGAETANTTSISAEVTRAEGAEGTLTTNLNNEISNRQSAVTAETARAETAETNLGNLITTANSSTSTVAANLATETSRAETAEATKMPLAGGTFTGPVLGFQDKGSQVFNVKAYGATGNGTTDDWAAIQLADWAANGQGIVYFPPGVYLMSHPIVPRSGNIWQGSGKAVYPSARLGAAPVAYTNPNLLDVQTATLFGSSGNWQNGYSASVALTTAQVLGGSAHSLAITRTSTSGGGTSAATSGGTYGGSGPGSFPVIAGNTYTVCGSSYPISGTVTGFRWGIIWFNAAGTQISTSWTGYTTEVVSTWTSSTYNLAAPALATSGAVAVEYNGTQAIGEIHAIGEIGVFNGSSISWNPGNAGGTTLTTTPSNWSNFGYAFLIGGGANASTDVAIRDLTIDCQSRISGSQVLNQCGGMSLGTHWSVDRVHIFDSNYFGFWIDVNTVDTVLQDCENSLGGNNDQIGGGSGNNVKILRHRWNSNMKGNRFDNVGGDRIILRDCTDYSTNSGGFYFEGLTRSGITDSIISNASAANIIFQTNSGYSPPTVNNPLGCFAKNNQVLGGGYIQITYYTPDTTPQTLGGYNAIEGNYVENSLESGINYINHGATSAWGTTGSQMSNNQYGYDIISHNRVRNPNAGNIVYPTNINDGEGTYYPSGISLTGGWVVVADNICIDDRITPQMIYGIEIGGGADGYITGTKIYGGMIQGASRSPIGWYTVTTPGVSSTGAGVVVKNVGGANPIGQVTPPTMVSASAIINYFCVDCEVYLTGGNVSSVAINGVITGMTSGLFKVPAWSTISVTYTGSPSWVWIGE